MDDSERKFSFSYDFGGEKLRLIDFSKEDDFLIDSPLFDSLDDLRLSESFDQSCQERENIEETILQKEDNLSPDVFMEPTRPSYLRRSLGWDSAFFNSAGVLDPDELSFINKGLNPVEDIRKSRSETKANVNGSRKIHTSPENKKTTPSSQRRGIQRSDKTKIACLSDSSRKIHSGKTESRKSKLYASTSLIETTPRVLKKSKELRPSSSSEMSFSNSRSRSKKQINELDARLGSSITWSSSNKQRNLSLSLKCDEIKSPDQTNIEAVIGTGLTSTEPGKKFKPSGLRQPSPKIGFFDEKKANEENHLLHSAPGIKGTRTASSDKKIRNSSPRVSRTMKSWSVASSKHDTRKSRNVDPRKCEDHHRGVKEGLKKRLGTENKARRDEGKIEREVRNQSAVKKANQETHWEDKVNDLSSYFDSIDLSNEGLKELERNENHGRSQNGYSSMEDHMDISSPLFSRKNISNDQNKEPSFSPNPVSENYILLGSRTPLIDKTSAFNRNSSTAS